MRGKNRKVEKLGMRAKNSAITGKGKIGRRRVVYTEER